MQINVKLIANIRKGMRLEKYPSHEKGQIVIYNIPHVILKI